MGGVIALNLLAREKELEILVCMLNAFRLFYFYFYLRDHSNFTVL